jgi:aspartate carbamoyltransferase regulatory subunit
MNTRIVNSIENGTVIDHIAPGKSEKVLAILNLQSSKNLVIIGMNLDSKTCGKKDLIKIENRELDKHHLDMIALVSPNATINLIKDFKVYKKFQVEIPISFENIIKCRNPACITRNETIISKFNTLSKDPLKVKCAYCEKVFVHFELM